MVCVSPFDTIVQVTVLVPKSAGTLITKTPQLRPTAKCVGWPWSIGPGSMRLFGPTGMSSASDRFRLK